MQEEQLRHIEYLSYFPFLSLIAKVVVVVHNTIKYKQNRSFTIVEILHMKGDIRFENSREEKDYILVDLLAVQREK